MTCLAAIEKAQYFPTPTQVVEKLASSLQVSFEGNGRILDPCAGEGTALAILAKAWGLKSYGMELDSGRAALAKSVLDVALQGSQHQIACPKDSFSALFLNPPYEIEVGEDGKRYRQESLFLIRATPLLAVGGLLIFIPPRHILDDELFRATMQRYYRASRVWRFPDPEYDSFKQVIVVALKRDPKAHAYGHYYSSHYFDGGNMLPLGEGQPYSTDPVVLPTYAEKFFFSCKGVSIESLLPSWEAGSEQGAFATTQWDVLVGDREHSMEPPLVRPKAAHQAMLLVSGALDGAEVAGRYLVKGSSEKAITVLEQPTRTVERERISSRLSVLDLLTGEHTVWKPEEDEARTIAWFNDYGTDLAREVQRLYQPKFDGDLSGLDFTPYRAPGILPGRTKPEFLEAQQAASAAVVCCWRHRKSAILSGEMGTGKTTCAVLATSLANHRKVVVICPSHLVPKWIRECETITRTPGIAMSAKTLSEIDRFFESEEDSEFPFGVTAVSPRFLVLSKDQAKLGAKWIHAYTVKKTLARTDISAHRNEDGDWVEAHTVTHVVKIVACPQCGKNQELLGILMGESHFDKAKCKCTECGEPLWQSAPISGKGTKRWALARYINRRYAHRYSLVIDECHQFASEDSDQSRAVQHMASGATRILAMTGTLYGGRASSIFHLLYKIDHVFRQMYKHNECPLFVQHHGLFETVYDEDNEKRTSVYGYRRGSSGGRVREIPGMNPAMIATLLPYTIFLRLKDLRLELPPYNEEVMLVDHAPEVTREVTNLASEVMTVLRKHPSLLGQYLMACLGYPDCPEHAESIILEKPDGTTEVLGDAKAFPSQPWPKDLALLKLIQEEKAQGRKVLVFFTQINKRDPRGRVRTLLELAGLKVETLDSSVAPEKREKWLADAQKRGFDVLFTNGKLVETGMDLLFAPTIVQFGIEYSINTLRQSVRRSWRLGQTEPVRVIFMAYRGTMQETALNLIARKMRAAEMLDGDDLGSLSRHDDSGNDLLLEIAQAAVRRVA